MCFTADESSEFYREGSRVARRDHRCTDCGRPIPRGTRYHYAQGKQDGAFWYEKRCVSCQAMAECIHWAELRAGCGEAESWPFWGGVRESLAWGEYRLLPMAA